MKKSLLSLAVATLFMLPGAYAQENSTVVTFNFSDYDELGNDFTFAPYTLEELQDNDSDAGKYLNEADGKTKARWYTSGNNKVLVLIGETLSQEGISMTMTNPGKYKDYPRIFFANLGKANPTNVYCDARWYRTQELAFDAPEGMKFDRIVMSATHAGCTARECGATKVVTEGGTQTFADSNGDSKNDLSTWEADAGSSLSRIVYKADADAPTQMAYTIEFTMSPAGNSGIGNVSVESEGETKYYDLTGVRHDINSLVPGLYIAVKDGKATKILVK